MPRLAVTPAQTVGPFFSIGLPWPGGPDAVPAETAGAVTLSGIVLDGEGLPIPDALVESWQAGAAGAPGRFARAPTDDDGHYAIRTVKPGLVPGPDGRPQAPHLAVSLLCRGLLHRVVTRIYFADEPAANAADPVLALVPVARRPTLLAQPAPGGYTFDLRLQGDHETVFFDI